MRPLRVLHVIPSLALEDGGPTRALLEMERGLAEAGMDVTTLTTSRPGDCLPAPCHGVRRISIRRATNRYKLAPGLLAVLPSLLRRHDVAHLHALFSFAPNAAAFAARALGVPYVVRPLGTLAPYGLARRRPGLKRLSMTCIEGPILRHAAAVHFTSHAEQAEAGRLKVPMRGVVIPLGLPPARDDGPEILDHPALSGRAVFLFMSRLDPKKNLEGLLDAVAASASFVTDAVLLIAGDGPADYVATLKARAARLGIADHVVWLGHVDGARKAAALKAADMFVLPSFSENFGIAAAEALAAGLPCLLGEGVAIANDVFHADAGIVVAPEAEAIRAALDHFIATPSRRIEMGRNARNFASDRYSSAAMARQLVALYEDIGAARRNGRP